jgi:hypothetical protein
VQGTITTAKATAQLGLAFLVWIFNTLALLPTEPGRPIYPRTFELIEAWGFEDMSVGFSTPLPADCFTGLAIPNPARQDAARMSSVHCGQAAASTAARRSAYEGESKAW